MSKRTVTVTEEFEYSKDETPLLLKKTTTTVTTDERADGGAVPSPYRRPYIEQGVPPYQHGGFIHYWDPKAPGFHNTVSSGGFPNARDC